MESQGIAYLLVLVLGIQVAISAAKPTSNEKNTVTDNQQHTEDQIREIAEVAAKEEVKRQNINRYKCNQNEYLASTGLCESCDGLCLDGENKKMCSMECPSKYISMYDLVPIDAKLNKVGVKTAQQQDAINELQTYVDEMEEKLLLIQNEKNNRIYDESFFMWVIVIVLFIIIIIWLCVITCGSQISSRLKPMIRSWRQSVSSRKNAVTSPSPANVENGQPVAPVPCTEKPRSTPNNISPAEEDSQLLTEQGPSHQCEETVPSTH